MQKLPTRLLEIEGQNGEVMGVKLVDTKNFPMAYACLSYCWGSIRQVFMTTTASRDEYRDAVPWRQLPPTISDAVKLCYKLGFQYLWIDSLCIIQDDHNDWLREASRMAGIYSRSALTLAIHLCKDTSASFLQIRSLHTEQWSDGAYKCARIPCTHNSTGEKGDIYVWHDECKASPILEWFSIRESGRNGPLGHWLRRAWTFQEWFLSPRVLHVHAMSTWDCLESRGNELEKRFLYNRPIRRADPIHLLEWAIIVSHFTSRHITMEKDRLPALAGLAEWYQLQNTYLAGLWLETLPRSLLWERCSRDPMRIPLEYRAPTWSWAALEGEVWFPGYPITLDDRLSSTCKIVGQYCQYDPPNSFATVTNGWIDIEGSMSIVNRYAMREDCRLSQISLFTHSHFEDIRDPQFWIASFDQDRIREEAIRHSEVYLLDLLVEPHYADESIIRRHALVLQTAGRPKMEKDCFQRLGIAYLDLPSSCSPITESWPRRTIRII